MEKESPYAKVQKIGEGAYGAVYKAINTNDKTIVALKVSRFEDCEEGIPSTCLRELSILKSLNHPNLIKLLLPYIRLLDAKLYQGSNPRLQMAFEYMDYDLSKFIKTRSENGTKGLSERESKIIIKKVLQGIHYMHKKGILHRDLKPHNILISKNLDVKIADFGLGRICSFPLDTMSKEIQTLWYRAPQLILGCNKYDQGVDSWSVGCIFFELVEGRALFQSDSEIGQLFEIFKTLGTPKLAQWPQIVQLQEYKKTFPKFHPNPPVFTTLSLEGQKWLFRLLKPNPKQRLSITKALCDNYLRDV